MPRLSWARECIEDVADDITPLLKAHYHEIAHFRDIPLKPDYARYIEAEKRDALRIFTVRAERTLVGYAIYFVAPHLHYSSSLHATQDILYLAPAYRQGGTGMRLIAYADRALAAEGVQVVVQHVKARTDLNFSPLLQRLGYELMDELWVRRLDGL